MNNTIYKADITIACSAQKKKTAGYTNVPAPSFFFMDYQQLKKYWDSVKNYPDSK